MDYSKFEIKSYLISLEKHQGAFTYTYRWEIKVALNHDDLYVVSAIEGSKHEILQWTVTNTNDFNVAIEQAVNMCKRMMGIH